MRPVFKYLIILGLVWLAFVTFWHVASVLQEGEGVEAVGSVIGPFLLAVVLAVVAAVFLALTVVPAIGQRIGSYFYNPDEEIEPDPHSPAIAKYAQGDYEGAIREYERLLESVPDDLQAASEIARIAGERLGDYPRAAACLEKALEVEHGQEETAHLAFRLVDLYEKHLDDHPRAVALLEQIIETMPETRHSANARHRLKEIGEAGRIQFEPEETEPGSETGQDPEMDEDAREEDTEESGPRPQA